MSVEQAKEVLTIEAEGILAVRDHLGEEFVRAVDLIMECPTRLVITGIGKSGIVGQKISATLNSTGTPSFFLHPVEAMHGDLGMVSSSDVVLAISYSGETMELNGLLGSLRERSVRVIAMTGNPDSTLAGCADVTLNVHVPREACPLGLAPTTSTTATLALGDALAVALLKRKQFRAEDFRRNHPGGSLGERLKVAVREVMLTGSRIPLVSDQARFTDAVAELNEKNFGAVVVVDDRKRLRGIITDGDVRRLILAHRSLEDSRISEVMTEEPVTITRDLMAADALSIMQSREITVLPVVGEDLVLEGILHLHDLLGKGEFRFLI
ncbi:D-arabinose 5-phosphate isomerase [Desulfolithobacter dissulfuricans]|uniref:D-arabinose 5-phosphate isomerase n=1 Tax=Desulfolithobacter dissulfuricans TaxID=2795293 RepID=A0A915XJE4_9BACT|nr:KpsF/GutQ family sugar-phosphate isomerase [Desulfolithobacter dissulfuricans]BCO10210.1 D-arabinose 5-phosphate isomerase [Desulfolithobacter dissulfuricans]